MEEQVLLVRKRKLGPYMEYEEPIKIQKRKPQIVTYTPIPELKKTKEDQSEKYIQDLESKNKALLAKITDLSNINKKLSKENDDLSSKLKNVDSSVPENSSKDEPKIALPEITTVSHKTESSTESLSTQELIDLWDQISSIPILDCTCNKTELEKRRARSNIKKYKASVRIKVECQ